LLLRTAELAPSAPQQDQRIGAFFGSPLPEREVTPEDGQDEHDSSDTDFSNGLRHRLRLMGHVGDDVVRMLLQLLRDDP
jgi:hypothetical protein